MIKVGDRVYNWRYGELKVTGLDNNYVHTNILDKDGIVDAGETWDTYLREPEKVFLVETFGHWFHDNIEDAVFGNNNNDFSLNQTSPDAMRFPIRGHLFHKYFASIISKYEDTLKSFTDVEAKINGISNEYTKTKNQYKKAVDNLLVVSSANIIEELIDACPSEQSLKDQLKNDHEFLARNNENTARLKVLTYLSKSHSENGYDFKECAEIVKANGKSEFTNDAAYKDFTILVEKQVKSISSELHKIFEDKANPLKETAKKISASLKINEAIDAYEINNINKSLLEDIFQILDEEMKVKNSKYESKRNELNVLLKKYEKLTDKKYVVFA